MLKALSTWFRPVPVNLSDELLIIPLLGLIGLVNLVGLAFCFALLGSFVVAWLVVFLREVFNGVFSRNPGTASDAPSD